MSVRQKLRHRLDKAVLEATRTKSNFSTTLYNILDAKVLGNSSAIMMDKHTKSDEVTMDSDNYNFIDGHSQSKIDFLPAVRTSLPDLSISQPKMPKKRLKDTDLDWIGRNWHKKNAQKLAQSDRVSQDVFEMLSKPKNQKFQARNIGLRIQFEKDDEDLKKKIVRLDEDVSPIQKVRRNLKEPAFDSKYHNSEGSRHEETHKQASKMLTMSDFRIEPFQQVKAAKGRQFVNENRLCPVATDRNFKISNNKLIEGCEDDGYHVYAKRLPVTLKLNLRTVNDFYTNKLSESIIISKPGSRVPSRVQSSHYVPVYPVIPISPYKMFKDEVMILSLEDTLIRVTSDLDQTAKDVTTLEDIQKNTALNESSMNQGNTSLVLRNSKSKIKSLGSKLKSVNNISKLNSSVVMLKERQDEYSVRKVTSVNPYKSYWMRCVSTCLNSEDIFEAFEAGYYMVQVFKDKLMTQEFESDEDKLTMKVELDIESEKFRFDEHDAKKMKILVDL